MKISSWNFAHVIMSTRLPATQILVSVVTLGASHQICEILPPCDFFWLSCPVPSLPFFSILRPDRTAGPIFTFYGSNDVFPRKDGPLWPYPELTASFSSCRPRSKLQKSSAVWHHYDYDTICLTDCQFNWTLFYVQSLQSDYTFISLTRIVTWCDIFLSRYISIPAR